MCVTGLLRSIKLSNRHRNCSIRNSRRCYSTITFYRLYFTISDCITICNEVAVRDTRNSTSANLVTLPYSSMDILKNSFAYKDPFIWNALPHDIRKCATLSCFKTALKAHILNVLYVITTMFTHFSKINYIL